MYVDNISNLPTKFLKKKEKKKRFIPKYVAWNYEEIKKTNFALNVKKLLKL